MTSTHPRPSLPIHRLTDSGIGTTGIVDLSEALRQTPTLQLLDLEGKRVSVHVRNDLQKCGATLA